MGNLERTVPDTLSGARLDKAVVTLVPEASRARVKKAIENGEVRVNGRIAAKGALVREGDVLTIDDALARSAEGPCVAEPEAPLVVRFENDDVVIVDKPAKMPTAPLRDGETGTLANALVGRYPALAGIGYSAREPGIVHRLDTDTSGLVVVARTADVFEILRDALRGEALEKEYLLVCKSEGLPDEGSIEYPITNHPKDKRRVYPCIHPRDVMRYSPRPASTSYRVEARKGAWALVRARAPKAVRHQLRAHFAAIGHPLAGDTLYGGREVPGLSRHALHAARVAWEGEGPHTGFDASSPLPDDMVALVR